ncbi:MAG: hypothetical protein WC138_00785 [Methanoculleus sp.]
MMVANRVAIVVAKVVAKMLRGANLAVQKRILETGGIYWRMKVREWVCLQPFPDHTVRPMRFHWKITLIDCTTGARCVFLDLLQTKRSKMMIH